MNVDRRNTIFQAALWSCFLVLAAASETASAQQVEIIANEAILRLDPDVTSPVIATLPAGTVLEWVGESGPYFAVSVPGAPGEEDLLGYILASEVAVVGAAGPTGTPSTSALGGGGMPIPNVQQQHANAKQSRSNGISRAVLGGVLASAASLTVSIAFDVEDRDSYEDEDAYQTAVDRQSTAESVKTVALVGGGALAAWGIGRYVLGWRTMSELERQFPEATTPSIDRQYAEATLNRSLGRRKFFWGVFLGGASFAAVEWVPFLAVPLPEDYEDAAEYQSAVNRRQNAEDVRNWVTGMGAVLGVWGVAQWVMASQKMGELEEMSRMSALSFPLRSSGSELPVNLFVGHADARTQFGVAWSW